MEGSDGVEPPDGVVIDLVQLGGVDHEPDDDFGFSARECALCDDGGHLLCCKGPCLRSFHATREDGQYSGCRSLGFTRSQVQAMEHFFCMNYTNREHQCAGCGELGSSDAANAQVFRCRHETCGRFYHPECISVELHPCCWPAEAARCRDEVAAGLPFQCQRPDGRLY